jgi:hypothetical protein
LYDVRSATGSSAYFEVKEDRRMKQLSMIVVLLAVAALGGLFGVPNAASAAPAGGMHSKGAVADALFTTRDPGGCWEWDTWVSAGVWTDTSSPGRPVKHSGLNVQIDVWDLCGDDHTIPWHVCTFRGSTEAADVKLSGQHASASGIVEASCRQSTDTLNVSVEWDAQNAPPGVIDGELPDPICTFQRNVRVRAATATGIVAFAYGGHSLAPDSSVWADIASGRDPLCTYTPW